MYILIKDTIPLGKAINAAAHAGAIAVLQWQEENDFNEWLNSFKKVTCKVSEEEFIKAKQFKKHIVLTESSMGGKEVAIVFCPRKEWPKTFKHYRLYS